MGGAPALDEPAHALRSEYTLFEGRFVPHVVVAHELVDELEAPVIPDGLYEEPDLLLVELASARHADQR